MSIMIKFILFGREEDDRFSWYSNEGSRRVFR